MDKRKEFLENYTVPSIVELEDDELNTVLELLVRDHIIVSEKQGNLFGCYLLLVANPADANAVSVFGGDRLVAKAVPAAGEDGELTDEIVDVEDDAEYDEILALFQQLEQEDEQA